MMPDRRSQYCDCVTRNADGGKAVGATVLTGIGKTRFANTFTGSASTFSSSGPVTSNGIFGGIGYSAGAGLTIAQATSKSTGVGLNRPCGQITMNNAALAANTAVSFTFTCNAIAADDKLDVWIKSGNATPGTYRVWQEGNAAGSRTVVLENRSAGSLSEAVVLGYAVLKAVIA